MKILRATKNDIDKVAGLFDLYRQFYNCDPDPGLARTFIGERILNNESAIFLAQSETGEAAGFVQLYPSFCSVEAIKIMILYDLYVAASFRRQGLGRMLMQQATEYAGDNGALRLDLLTAKDNFQGQSLYEQLGYVRTNDNFFAYSLTV